MREATLKSNYMEKEYKRWEKSSMVDGVEKSICVEEAENGFITTIRKTYYNEDYKCDKKVYISTTNPLDPNEKEIPVLSSLKKYVNDLM